MYDDRRKLVIQYGTDDPWELIGLIVAELETQKQLYGALVISLQKSGVKTIPLNGEAIPEVKDALSQAEWLGFDPDKHIRDIPPG